MNEHKKIGVWQTAFLGDAVLTLPLIRTLRRAYLGAEIHYFVRQGYAPLFAAQPELAGVRGFAKRGGQKSLASAWHLGREIAGQGFDLWVSAHTSLRSGIVSLATSIPTRIGYDRPLFNRLFYTHAVDRRFRDLDEIERLLRLVEPLGIRDVETWPALVVPAESAERADEFWRREIGDAPAVGVHPGSVWPTKRWPGEHFARLVTLAAKSGAKVLLFGTPGEEERLAEEVARAAGPLPDGAVKSLAGKLSLPDLAAYLGRLDVYVTNDSGPMHIAWAQSTPLVALFGPTVKSLGFFPRGESSRVMELPLPCRPCGLHGGRTCPLGHHRCMRDLAPEAVWEAASGLIAARRAGRVREDK